MNNLNPNYNVSYNGDENNELFSSQNKTWHSYANRLSKPNSHQNVTGFNGEDYYDKYVPQNHQGISCYNNYAGPSNVNYIQFQAGRNNNDAAPFNYVVPSLPVLNEPTRNVNNFQVQSPFIYPVPSLPVLNEPTRNLNNFLVQSRAPNNYPVRDPVPSLPVLNEPKRNFNNFPVQSPVTNNDNIRRSNGDFYNFFVNNEHEKIVKSSVTGNEVRVLTYTRDEYDRINLGKNLNCNFCKRLGKPRHLYSSHNIRENGLVSCPVLRQCICSVCHRRGHTSKYCQSVNVGASNN